MSNEQAFSRIKAQLDAHSQSHLLAFWDALEPEKQRDLCTQIEKLDFEQLDQRIQDFVIHDHSAKIPTNFTPASAYPETPETPEMAQKYAKATALGEDLLRAGQVGAFVVAGGQGTRLGFSGPKGNYPISPIKHKTLFELFAESILATSQKFNARCPWYIMTSPLNHEQTRNTLRANDYFGLPEEDVFVFQQGTWPNFSMNGQIFLADQDALATSPDGHGGSLKALYESHAVDHMRERGVETLSYWQVDNPLINIFDPLFIGLHVLDKSQMSSKALIKTGPMEKVGNFCRVNDKVTVVEYSDLPDEEAKRKNPDGSLVFELGSIGIHLVSRSFVEELNAGEFSLPIHRAVKKIPHITPQGDRITPDTPNGIKLETFVFDALPLASHSMILRTHRHEEFGPVKNATGVDSAETSRQMIIDRAAAWLESAGIEVPRTQSGQVDCCLEIAPSFALTPGDLKARLDQIPEIKPGDSVYLG
ncbi:MAG: UDPGP type 1 family protein [Phycisphaeraceae bacterium]|nr:UDPGP type 1 family protein [Phycisphaeraceae bacterium]